MEARIARLVKQVKETDVFPKPVPVSYDPFDEKLPEPIRIAKRLSEYMAAQPVVIADDNELVGLMRFDGSVEADLFQRAGHRKASEAFQRYYCKPQENLVTMEWQHSNQDFGKLVRIGLEGLRSEIAVARRRFAGDYERLAFLAAFEMTIRGVSRRADQCAVACRESAGRCVEPKRREALLRMASNCAAVPRNPARTFEEAVQCVYFAFQLHGDSLGRPDQYLYALYARDLASGALTRERAKALLQELFAMIHGWTPPTSPNADRGGESHFVVGGYTVDREDGFNDLSELILESMMECDLIRPQVTLRWTEKTPRAVLRKVLAFERADRNKRIAFVNDEPRIAAAMDIRKFPWAIAHDYIMVGCNEPAFQGGIDLGGNNANILRCLVNTLNGRRSEILECGDFEGFYAIVEQEMFRDLERVVDYCDCFNALRSGDCNVLSSLFLDGCIQRAQSATRGGCARAVSGSFLIGTTNLVDSLCVVSQFVFDEKRVSMAALAEALDNDWKGAEDLRAAILRDGRFFGNNDDFSNGIARRFHASLYRFAKSHEDIHGLPFMFGNLTGYKPHFAWFGSQTPATPDGRVSGSALLFGSGQSGGKDRDGATSHLLSVAHMDPWGAMCGGGAIMNLTVEGAVGDAADFDRLVSLVETYFREGGSHIQMNYITRDDMLAAKVDPHRYKGLRVRVSGFSASFVELDESIQDNVIGRTESRM